MWNFLPGKKNTWFYFGRRQVDSFYTYNDITSKGFIDLLSHGTSLMSIIFSKLKRFGSLILVLLNRSWSDFFAKSQIRIMGVSVILITMVPTIWCWLHVPILHLNLLKGYVPLKTEKQKKKEITNRKRRRKSKLE